MIKKFSVRNFKNFNTELVLDFSKTRDYSFNQNLIKNGLVNKMVIYGPNNSGKSNLGAAIMDITNHLTDYNGQENKLYLYYLNGNYVDDEVSFKYEFLFDDKEVEYSYKKDANRRLISEKLFENHNLLFEYNYRTNKYTNNIKEAKDIDIKKRNQDISVLKYIYINNIYLPDDSSIKQLMEFVQNMLWFRSLQGNEFMGVMANGEDLNDFIINNRLLKKFQDFLIDCGQDYQLCEIEQNGKRIIGVDYKNYKANFSLVASTGTKTLWLFFYWMNRLNNISFIYLDEFDAFYHFELSRYILNYVNNKNSFQSVLTSHNTFLIDNEIMRPDCYAILKDGKIASLAERTGKTIRQAHNLEKMMLGKEFE